MVNFSSDFRTDKVKIEYTGYLDNKLVKSVKTTIEVELFEKVDITSKEYESVYKSIREEIEIPVRNNKNGKI